MAGQVKSQKTATEKVSKRKTTGQKQKQNSAKKQTFSHGKRTNSSSVEKVSKSGYIGRLSSFSEEIRLWVIIGVMAFLFLCTFHLCPGLGNYIFIMLHGFFGFMAYFLPIHIAVSSWFYIRNTENRDVQLKVLIGQVLFVLLDTAIHLLCVNSDEVLSPVAYYEMGQTGITGGIVGGLLSGILQQAVGFAGTLLLLLIGIIICAILLSEHSLMQPIQNFSEDLYSNAREDISKKKQERQQRRVEQENSQRKQERQQRYVEQEKKAFNVRKDQQKPTVHKGVMIGTKLKEEVPERATRQEKVSHKSPAVEETAATAESQQASVKKEGKMVSLYKDVPQNAADGLPVEEKSTIQKDKKTELSKETSSSQREIVHPEDNEFRGTIYRNGFRNVAKKQQVYAKQDERTLEELQAFDSSEGVSIFAREVLSEEQQIQFVKEPEIQGIPMGGLEQSQSVETKTESVEVKSESIEEKCAFTEQTKTSLESELSNSALSNKVENEHNVSGQSYKIRFHEPTPQDKTTGKLGSESEIQKMMDTSYCVKKGEADSEQDTKQDTKKEPLLKKETSIWKQDGVNRQDYSSGTTFTDIPKDIYEKQEKMEYQLPSLDLLHPAAKGDELEEDDDSIQQTSIKLQQTLRNFGVGVTVGEVCCGPTVTRYELHPDQGVKVSKILSLADDIKLNLAAADIRIEAPIPGKSAVGIEVPNAEQTVVSFRDLVESSEFTESQSKLTFAIGKDISGSIIVSDIAKMPHLLIAGATGSGKSVCINTLIMSILYKAKPEEVGLIMIDPKVVELSIYNGIPHLMIPIVTDPHKAASALNWAVSEMEDRYRQFAEYNVRNLKGYNDKIRQFNKALPEDAQEDEKIPLMKRIVVIVDELADLMMVVSGEVEDAICRLSQKARAAGIHLVLATQRPSVDVITGLIKANIPSRIAFAVSSGTDARTILGENGAEKLLGKGDMLLKLFDMPKPVRVQGAFISDEEVEAVVDFLKKNASGHQNYHPDLEQRMEQDVELSKGSSERDEYFERAGRFVIEKEKATIGMMQRAFKIGFNRAARIMDQLYEAGVVGEGEGTKPRKVLMTMEEFEDEIL